MMMFVSVVTQILILIIMIAKVVAVLALVLRSVNTGGNSGFK
jgi:phage-related minor tail protein